MRNRSVVCLTVMLVAAMVAGGVGVSFADEAKVKDAMAALEAKTVKLGAPTASGTSLLFGSTKMNGNYTIVDEIKTEKGCTATLFVKSGAEYIRISTNVVVDGSRAIGTQLAKNKAYEALGTGNSFYGEIDVLGKKYDAGYEPIKSADGTVIGAWYIGFPKA